MRPVIEEMIQTIRRIDTLERQVQLPAARRAIAGLIEQLKTEDNKLYQKLRNDPTVKRWGES